MNAVRVPIDPDVPASLALGRVDLARVDATTEVNIANDQAVDESTIIQDGANFGLRVRKRQELRLRSVPD